jgi:crotonobetainyl-CoA:carnitine CoA-transferase CaiB-like acyl-CoA transferase
MQALDGLRVLDLGTFIAGPYVATVLGEFGADVIKIEPPGRGDDLRRFGTDTDCGDTLVWLTEARNKRSVTLNLRDERGQQLLRRLISQSDVVVENFRPGVLERWGLSYDTMAALNPGIILVRISGYGQTGPDADLPGFARVAHGVSGLAYLAGEAGRPPVVPGSTSMADYISGLYGAIAVLLALQARTKTGRGQQVDLALYESTFRLLDEIAPAFQKFGFVRERMGADTVNVVPHSHYETADGKWVAIACSHDDMFARLARAMGRPELSDEDQFKYKTQRLPARETVNGMVADWVRSLPREEVLARCRAEQAAAGPVNSIADIFDDPQYKHRQTIVEHASRIGPLAVPNTVPRLSDTPGEIRWLGPQLGAHTDEVLTGVLQLSAEEIAALRDAGVV